ncbi:MAG: 16S rRNA (cytidine(1402)-2'-O)-methyltransferase [Candidatus Berkelbacteria bacterium]
MEKEISDNLIGTLYVVATPIGNLKDITLRALEIFKSVDMVACEDTRVGGFLLHHFEIKKPLVSYFQHSKMTKIDYIIDELKAGKNIALITDAGTPGISDPGQQLVSQVHLADASIKVIPIPGVTALAAAVSVSGMVEKSFYFAGFLPKKKGRQTEFKFYKTLDCPIIIYESAMRLEKTLLDVQNFLGSETEVFISREITKMHEEYWGGNVSEIISDLKSHQMKGELVLIIKQIKAKKAKKEMSDR